MPDAVSIPGQNPMQRVLHQRDFVLLWAGQGMSLLGDQFYMVAAPWLVLKLNWGSARIRNSPRRRCYSAGCYDAYWRCN